MRLLATHSGVKLPIIDLIQTHFEQWKSASVSAGDYAQLTAEQLHSFVTASVEQGGLGAHSWQLYCCSPRC